MDQLALPGQVREASPRRWKRDKHFKRQEQNVKNFGVWNGLTSSRSISVWEACCSRVRGTVRDGREIRAGTVVWALSSQLCHWLLTSYLAAQCLRVLLYKW